MEKEQLKQYINQNLSSYQIAKLIGKSQTSIRYWLKKFNLKTNYHQFKKGKSPNKTKINIESKYNWKDIQEYYDIGKTWKDIVSKFGISMAALNSASKEKLFKTRTPQETLRLKGYKNPPLSQETKDKLSNIRKDYLKSNNIHRWHNKSSYHTSWFCESVKNKLKEENILFQEEFMPLKHINRFFSLDIAFPDLKIGFELNGRQHYDNSKKLLPYYQKRHDLITENGWKLFEIPYSTKIEEIISLIKYQIK